LLGQDARELFSRDRIAVEHEHEDFRQVHAPKVSLHCSCGTSARIALYALQGSGATYPAKVCEKWLRLWRVASCDPRRFRWHGGC
jgi:hypothetical protein